MSKLFTWGLGGYDPSKPNNNLISEVELFEEPISLNPVGVIATLNAVLGLWTLRDAANVAGVTEAELIHEAQAWAAAQTESE
jgi:hypothetical protein